MLRIGLSDYPTNSVSVPTRPEPSGSVIRARISRADSVGATRPGILYRYPAKLAPDPGASRGRGYMPPGAPRNAERAVSVTRNRTFRYPQKG